MSGLVRVGEGAPIGTLGLEGTSIFNDYNALASQGEYCSCMLRSAAMRIGNCTWVAIRGNLHHSRNGMTRSYHPRTAGKMKISSSAERWREERNGKYTRQKTLEISRQSRSSSAMDFEAPNLFR